MKKYTLTNYAETTTTASSSTSDSGIIDSGVIDSGIVDSGLIDSGLVDLNDVDPEFIEGEDNINAIKGASIFYTESEMYSLMQAGQWQGGIVNGAYVPPLCVVANLINSNNGNAGTGGTGTGGTGTGGTGTGGTGTSGTGTGGTGTGGTGTGGTGTGGTGTGGTGGTNQQPGTSGNQDTATSSWSELSNGITWYSVEEAEELMEAHIWVGGYVTGYGYVLPQVTVFGSNTPASGLEILQRARAFEGTPYLWGGNDANGIDCSGLLCATCNFGYRWNTGVGYVPGFRRITYGTESNFWNILQKGDILLFPHHVAIYVEGKSIYHSCSSKGVAETDNLESYWIAKNGYPKIYRKP